MENKKTILVSLVIFGVLLLIACYPWIEDKINFGKQDLNDYGFSNFSEEKTKEVSIKSSQHEITLSKQDNIWKVNEFNASVDDVQAFFKSLIQLKTDKLVSQNAQNHKSLGVGESQGYTVSFLIGDKRYEYIFSENNYSQGSFNFRKTSSDEVYSTKGLLPAEISYTVGEWRDKNIVNIKPEQVQRMEVYLPNEKYKIKKEQDIWRLEKDENRQEMEASKISLLSGAFKNFSGSDILDENQMQELDSKKDKIVIKIYDFSNDVLLETYLMKKEQDYWAKVVGKDDYFLLNSYKIPADLLDFQKLQENYLKK